MVLNSDDDFTIVSYLGLYCDYQIERNYIQSVLSIGCLVGLFVVNSLSDLYGRKFAVIFVLAVSILGVSLTILGGYLKSIGVLIFSQFCCGFAGYSLIIVAYIIPADFLQGQFRQKSVIIISGAWSITTIITGLCYFYFHKWNQFLIIVVLIPIIGIFLLSTFFLFESPNFLFRKKKIPECLEVLEMIAIINGKTDNFHQVKYLITTQITQQEQAQDKNISITKALQNKPILKKILLFILVQSGANIYYFGSNYALDQIGLNYGVNMIMNGTVELAAYIVLIFISGKMSPRFGVLLYYSIILVLSLLFAIKLIEDSVVLSLIVLGLIRFFVTLCFTILIIMVTYSFPSSIQSTCAGIVEGVASLGNLVAPFLITFGINQQIHPIIVLSAFILLFILIPMLAYKPSEVKVDGADNQQEISNTHDSLIEPINPA